MSIVDNMEEKRSKINRLVDRLKREEYYYTQRRNKLQLNA